MREFKNKHTGDIVKTYSEHYYISTETACIPKRFIELSNDWEEIIEKDYEMLLINHNQNILKYESPMDCVKTIWSIHSVKRLSDGEIFTIGDRAKSQGSSNTHNIRQFRVRQKWIRRDGEGGYNYDGIDRIWIDWEEACGGNWLESTEKAKQPIFLTHDGEDIFWGYSMWYINKENFNVSWAIADSNHTFNSDRNAYFLTAAKARDYQHRNKGCLSYNDVMEALNLNRWGIDKLQELVNIKLRLQ